MIFKYTEKEYIRRKKSLSIISNLNRLFKVLNNPQQEIQSDNKMRIIVLVRFNY